MTRQGVIEWRRGRATRMARRYAAMRQAAMLSDVVEARAWKIGVDGPHKSGMMPLNS